MCVSISNPKKKLKTVIQYDYAAATAAAYDSDDSN
jgi:hypothetical protein